MKHSINVQTKISEGAIERILGKIRGRGWSITQISAQIDASEKHYAMSLIIEGDRSIENLILQIEKLYDVEFASTTETNKLQTKKPNTYELPNQQTQTDNQLQFRLPLRHNSQGWDAEKGAERYLRRQA